VLDRLQSDRLDPARLAELLDQTPEALVAFDAQRNILHANQRAAAVFGYEAAALAGRSTDLLIPERLRQPDAPPMRATQDLMQVELPGLMRDGQERTIEWCFGAARTGDRPTFVMTVRDRLELDRALEALRASEQKFQLLINGVQDCAIFMLDPQGRVSSWNTGAARIKGWTTAEIIGQPYEIFFTPEDRAAGLPRSLLADALRDGSREVTGWRMRKNGARFWMQGSLTLLRGPDGNVEGFAKVTRDLTAKRNAEENERRLIAERAAREAAQTAEQQLRDGEERLRRLQQMTAALSQAVTPEEVATVVLREGSYALGATGGTVYLLTENGRELEALDHRGEGAGLPAELHRVRLDAHFPHAEAARRRAPIYFESFADCVRQYPEIAEKVASGKFEAAALVPLVAGDTLVGAMGLRFAARRTFDATARALMATVADLCSQALDRARLFRAERAARDAAETANRSKDEFLAMLGHELRNPLAPIRTAVQLMKLRNDPASAREREVIERQVGHLGRLVDDLLDVSRVARGMISLSKQPVETAEIIDKAVEMVAPLFTQRAQHLKVTAPRTGLRLNADSVRLAQVIANLLDNAAKYTTEGGRVWVTAAREGQSIVIRVRDDGGGITAELLPKVFDLFVQGAQSVARPEGGLGLGLALVKSFVGLHGGTVSAASEGPGRGSEFVVRLPGMSTSELPVAWSETPPPQPSPGKRILVVDDNEDAGEMLAELLRTLGHEVQVAPDGPTALRSLRTFPAEIAILDLGLPVMDGFELARQVQVQQEGKRPRLIAVTGYGRDRDIAASRAAGFDVHLVKPVDIDALVKALEPAPRS